MVLEDVRQKGKITKESAIQTIHQLNLRFAQMPIKYLYYYS
jgi:hypothetical protein